MMILPQNESAADPEKTLSDYISNIEFWIKNTQRLAGKAENEKADSAEVRKQELSQLTNFLKNRLFKRAIAVKKNPDDLKSLYLKCLAPYYTRQGVGRFIERYFNVSLSEEDRLVYRVKDKLEKESIILMDLYKVKKTIETIDTLKRSTESADPFKSRFSKEEQVEFLKTLREIFKMFFVRFVRKEYQKELFTSFSEKHFNPKSLAARNKQGTSYIQPELFKTTEHRDKFTTVLFSTALRAKVNDKAKDLDFNYLNFEILKFEFLVDWLARKLKGNPEKQSVLESYKIGDKSVAEIIKANPAKEMEILLAMPIEAFNDLAEQVNINVKDEDKVPIATLSMKHGVMSRIQTQVGMIKRAVLSSTKKKVKKTKPTNNKEKAAAMVESVKAVAKVREISVEAMENFMDSARSGKMDENEINGFIDSMVGNSDTDAISAIATLKKSSFVYAHCVDVSGIYTKAYNSIMKKLDRVTIFKDPKEVPFVGFMHDFGMSSVPKEILESVEKFAIDGEEMSLIRQHPQKGVEMFQKMNQPEHLLAPIHFHHVKMSVNMDSSYPDVPSYDSVNWEARLLAIVDVYQALVGKRAYKTSWSPPAAIRYLDNLAGTEYDSEIWDLFREVMGEYPVGSLVKLSDESLAYVMSVPETDLKKPEVVVVKGKDGKLVEKHELINLAEVEDIKIKEDVDAQEIFGEKALDIFTGINIA